MNLEQTHTSKELSKKLQEAGCDLYKSEYVWRRNSGLAMGPTMKDKDGIRWELSKKSLSTGTDLIPAYDILNDLCVKYVEQVFSYEQSGTLSSEHIKTILIYMVDGNKKAAEGYLWENCLFNKNK